MEQNMEQTDNTDKTVREKKRYGGQRVYVYVIISGNDRVSELRREMSNSKSNSKPGHIRLSAGILRLYQGQNILIVMNKWVEISLAVPF